MEQEQQDPMPGDTAESDSVPIDMERVESALSAAADLLQSAELKNNDSEYEEAILLARDSMRMASSAVLFLDGKVASDLNGSCSYLHEKYGDVLQVEDWKEVELLSGTGLVKRLTNLLRMGSRQKDAEKALTFAAKFFGATSAIVNVFQEHDVAGESREPSEEKMAPAEPEEELFGEAS